MVRGGEIDQAVTVEIRSHDEVRAACNVRMVQCEAGALRELAGVRLHEYSQAVTRAVCRDEVEQAVAVQICSRYGIRVSGRG